MKLTQRRIERLTVELGRKDRLVFDDEQRGLAVRITANGGRSYLAQYSMHGAKHRVPLGACSALSLAAARKAAEAIMGRVALGKNPAVERKEAAAREKAKRAREQLTLETLIDDWKRIYLSQRRSRYAEEATRALRHAFGQQLQHAAEEMDRTTVVRALDRLTGTPKDGQSVPSGTAIANRTAAYGRALFSWAMKRGSVERNPFHALPALTSAPKRDRVLSDRELMAIWNAAGNATVPYCHIIRMLILTGQRREEVAGMAWGEVSDDLETWTISAHRTKNGIVHMVPLSESATDILRSLLPADTAERKREIERRRSEVRLVFPGKSKDGNPFGGWSKSKVDLDSVSGVIGWRLHDLRRTLATGLQRLGVRLEVTEAVLNHISGSRDGIVGVYQRHNWANEKRAALNAWAAYIANIPDVHAEKSNVIRTQFR